MTQDQRSDPGENPTDFVAVQTRESARSADVATGGFRISVFRLGALFVTLILLAIIWNLFLTPNNYGKPLGTALRAMDKMSHIAGSAPQYARVKIEPIRNTTGSVWSSELASMMQSGESKSQSMGGLMANSHGPGVVMAMQEGFSSPKDHCTVRVSAQAFDFPGTPYAPILSRVGSREDSFVLMLAHEMAHCYWNPGPAYEDRINKVEKNPVALKKMLSLMPLVRNIAESYADSYALIFSARMDSGLYARGYQGLFAFRSEKSGQSNIYETLNALQAVSEMAPTLPGKSDPLNVRWDVTNRFAMSAAFTGSLKWLTDKGVARDEAIESIRLVIEGQGIEFSPHTIAGKEYLIVSKTPEDVPSSLSADSSTSLSTVQRLPESNRPKNESRNGAP